MKVVKLKEVANIYDGIHETPNYKDFGVKFVSVEDIKNLYQSNKYISKLDYDKLYTIKPEYNDILMTRIGDIGTPAICNKEEPLAYYVSLALIKPISINTDYLYFALQSQLFKKESYKRTIHVAFPKKINLSEIGECLIPLPETNLQTKIATFLNLYYKKIELQKKKVEILEKQKSGIFNHLLINSKDYHTYRVIDIFSITRGLVVPKSNLSNIKTDEYIYPTYSSQTSNNGLLGYSKNFLFEKQCLTWTTDGANAGKVFLRSGKFNCTNVCGVLLEKLEFKGYANEYVEMLLNTLTPNHVSYVGNPKLMNNVMGSIKFNLPSLAVMKSYSNILAKLTLKIQLEHQKFEALEKYKQGLLQKMFI